MGENVVVREYSSEKFDSTIYAIDRDTLEFKTYKNDQINLEDCSLVQVQDSLYSIS